MGKIEENRRRYPITAEIVDRVREHFPDAAVKSTTEKQSDNNKQQAPIAE